MPSRPDPAAPAGAVRGHPYLLLSVAALLWSGNFVLARGVRAHVPPLALAFWRWTIALVVLLPFTVRAVRASAPALLRSWRVVLGLGVLGVGNFNMLVYVGVHETTATNAVLLNSACPAFIVALSSIFGAGRPTGRQLTGILVSLVGILVIVSGGRPGALRDLSFNRGDLWVLAAVLSWAAYTVLLAWRPADVEGTALLTATVAVGVAWILPFHVVELARGARMTLDLETIGSVAYVALFASVVAYFCWNRGVALVGANRAGVFMHLLPAFGSVLAAALLREAFRPHHLAGIAAILAGVYLAGTLPARRSAVARVTRTSA